MKKQRKVPRHQIRYSLMDELLASPHAPLPLDKRRHQLTRIWGGVQELETADMPSIDAWQVCSDAVNLVETLVRQSPWTDCAGAWVDVQDKDGLLGDAIEALALSGGRMAAGQGAGLGPMHLQAVRSIVSNYSDLADTLPARTMIRCHRATERRIYAVLDAIKSLPDRVQVVAI